MDAFCLFSCISITLVVTSSGIALKRSSDHQLSKQDISQLFGTDNHADVPDHEFINLDNLIKHQQDGRKDALCLKAFGSNMCVKFMPNKQVGGKTHTIEYHDSDGTVNKYTNVLRDYNLGIVNDERSSHAAFYHCGRGLTGHMKVANDLYIVNPLPHNLKSDKGNHIIYRRKRRDTTSLNLTTMADDRKRSDATSLNLTMLEDGIDGLKMMESQIEDAIKKGATKAIQAEKTMELMIAADYTMVKFYTEEFLTSYIVAMANIIYGFFQDPSLSYPMTVALVKIVIFKEDKFKAKTVNDLLAKFTAWCEKNNPKDDKDPEHWDNGMILTRNGCADGCGIEGLAVISMCTLKSTSVSKDHGLMSAMTAVHEIGHNLHAPHDGGSNICPDGVNFMATGSAHGPHQEEWSSCSSYVVEKAMKSPGSKCYDDKPAEKSLLKFRLYGQVYNRVKQCQFMYGDVYRDCVHTVTRCSRLFCAKNISMNTCVAMLPPVDGTNCGPHMWCIHDKCVPDGTTPAPPVNGGWSAWSDYTTCSKVCGIGDQWKERKCNNPAPHRGGKSCKGIKRAYFRTCNTQKCVGKEHPTALEQCQKIRKAYTAHYHDNSNQCLLNCGTKGSNVFVVEGWKAEGTKCRYSPTNPAICINNKCRGLGCDRVLGSGAVPDRCGVCDGDGSTCQLYTGKDMKAYNNYYGHHLLTTIPAGSINITVEEMHPTWLGFLGFKVGKSPHYAFRLPWLYFGQANKAAGTAIRFWSKAYTYADKLHAKGKIDKPISIYYYSYYGPHSTNKGVTWRYYGPATGTPVTPTFKWVAKEWSTCSRKCAGGKQKRDVLCFRTDDNSQVSKISCSSLKPLASVQSCNTQDCVPDWYVTEWSSCSKSCGKGVLKRDILCSIKTMTTRKTASDLNLCIEAKPKVKLSQDCHVKMCPACWSILSEYGECSASCGGGIQTRSVLCQHITADGLVRKTHPNECIKHKKPADKKKCNVQACTR